MHVVRQGDTLVAIARRHRVRGGWPELYAANRTVVGARPGVLRIGTMLALPPVGQEAPAPAPPPVSAVPAPAVPAVPPPGPSATPPRPEPSSSPGPVGSPA
ncbi:LysM peptidoglycan-binding domain-containing protein [Streptomyces sp. AP-93]|nr:LysM peptidoglycan-binding domain-containing protein [Streptomyces sp. AP-93]